MLVYWKISFLTWRKSECNFKCKVAAYEAPDVVATVWSLGAALGHCLHGQYLVIGFNLSVLVSVALVCVCIIILYVSFMMQEELPSYVPVMYIVS